MKTFLIVLIVWFGLRVLGLLIGSANDVYPMPVTKKTAAVQVVVSGVFAAVAIYFLLGVLA